MCGIAGKFYFNSKAVTEQEILNMTDALSHRGPDDAGFMIDHNVGLGHRRLSIIDLSPAGHQPMSDKEKTYWIVFNGEIYNFLELRDELEKDGVKFKSHTDTEVIIYLYRKYGPECVKKLRGMFAFAVWNVKKRELFVARDRIGVKPLKYYCENGTFLFASELKAILKNQEVKKEIDYQAIDQYLSYGYVPSPYTGFKSIYKLEPAHYLIVKESGEVIKKKYWDLDFSKKQTLTAEEWEEKTIKKIKEAVKIRLMADVPLGAHLSGGVDSGLIVALMAEQTARPIQTFSVGFKELQYNELPYAELVANKYGTKHQEIIIEPSDTDILSKLAYFYEEPFADNSALPTWYLCQATKKNITVALNGDGGDENFAGYYRYQAVKMYQLLKFLPMKNLSSIIINKLLPTNLNRVAYQAKQFFSNLTAPSELEYYRAIISRFNAQDKRYLYNSTLKEKIISSNNQDALRLLYESTAKEKKIDRFLHLGISMHLPDDLSAKIDIASMSHGLEVRSPLLDHQLFELTAQMPSNLKLSYFNKKYLLKKIAHRYLPSQCINRPKQGFELPLEFWLGQKFGDISRHIINHGELAGIGMNLEVINKMINGYTQKDKATSLKIWSLCMLSEWLRNYELI